MSENLTKASMHAVNPVKTIKGSQAEFSCPKCGRVFARMIPEGSYEHTTFIECCDQWVAVPDITRIKLLHND